MARNGLSKYVNSIIEKMGYEIIPGNEEDDLVLVDKNTGKVIFKSDINLISKMNDSYVPTNTGLYNDTDRNTSIDIEANDGEKEKVIINTGYGLRICVSVQYEDSSPDASSVEISISNILDGKNKILSLVYNGYNIPYNLIMKKMPGIALKEKNSKEPIVRIFHDISDWGYYTKGDKSCESFKLEELNHNKIIDILLKAAENYNYGFENLSNAMNIISPAIRCFVDDFIKDWFKSLNDTSRDERESRDSLYGNTQKEAELIEDSFDVSAECLSADAKLGKHGQYK